MYKKDIAWQNNIYCIHTQAIFIVIIKHEQIAAFLVNLPNELYDRLECGGSHRDRGAFRPSLLAYI